LIQSLVNLKKRQGSADQVAGISSGAKARIDFAARAARLKRLRKKG
jgi:hypothetical protein